MITLEPPRSLAGEAKPWQKLGLSRAGLARFLNRARTAVGLEGEVHVLLADDATLKRLNKTFRGKNVATDVLSFPAGDVRVLLLHGVLHLAGFDHEADAGEMAAREAELRRELRVETSLIARVTEVGTTTKADSSAALRNDKLKNKQMRTAGILPAPASKLAGGPVRFAQNDKRYNSARDDGNTVVAGKGVRA
jgi:probable rRNA maturation factor